MYTSMLIRGFILIWIIFVAGCFMLPVYRSPTSSWIMIVCYDMQTCPSLLPSSLSDFFCLYRVTSAVEEEPSLPSGHLNTATTPLDLAYPAKYDHMAMLFLNKNSNGFLKADQWTIVLQTQVGLIEDSCPGQNTRQHVINYSTEALDVSPCRPRDTW